MNITLTVSNWLNDLPLAPLAGVLWISWLVALILVLFFRNGSFCVLHGKLLIVPTFLMLCWHALIMISSGKSPIVTRADLAGLIRILDLLAVVLLWIWLILVLRRRIVIEHEND